MPDKHSGVQFIYAVQFGYYEIKPKLVFIIAKMHSRLNAHSFLFDLF